MNLLLSDAYAYTSPPYRYNAVLPTSPTSPVRRAHSARPAPKSPKLPATLPILPNELVAHIISYVEPTTAVALRGQNETMAATVASNACVHGINAAWGNQPPPLAQWAHNAAIGPLYAQRLDAEAHWDKSVSRKPKVIHEQWGSYGAPAQTRGGQHVFVEDVQDKIYHLFDFGCFQQEPVARAMDQSQTIALFGRGELLRAQFSADGTTLALATTTGRIIHYGQEHAFTQARPPLTMACDDVRDIVFSADLSHLAAVVDMQDVPNLLLASTQALALNQPGHFQALADIPRITQLTADGQHALVGYDHALWLFSANAQKPARCLFSDPNEHIISAHLMGQTLRLCTAMGEQARLRQGTLATGLHPRVFQVAVQYLGNALQSATFNRTGSYLVCQSRESSQTRLMHVVDMHAGMKTRSLYHFNNRYSYQVTFAPDDTMVMLTPQVGRFEPMTPNHGIVFHKLNRPEQAGWSLTLNQRIDHAFFRQNAKHVVTCTQKGDMVLWKIKNPYERKHKSA